MITFLLHEAVFKDNGCHGAFVFVCFCFILISSVPLYFHLKGYIVLIYCCFATSENKITAQGKHITLRGMSKA
jgi:hypothetical protein